jgi:hypothetical protein
MHIYGSKNVPDKYASILVVFTRMNIRTAVKKLVYTFLKQANKSWRYNRCRRQLNTCTRRPLENEVTGGDTNGFVCAHKSN